MNNYRENLEKYFELCQIEFDKTMTEQEVIDKLIQTSIEKREIQVMNNHIIKENIEKYEKDLSLVDEDVARLLGSFSESIRDREIFYDRGISQRITRILLDYYFKSNNYDLVAFSMYMLAYFSMNCIDHSKVDIPVEKSDEIDNIMELYPSMSEAGRKMAIQFILACVYDTSPQEKSIHTFEKAKKFMEEKNENPNDPDNYGIFSAYRFALVDTTTIVKRRFLDGKDNYSDQEYRIIRSIVKELEKAIKNESIPFYDVTAKANLNAMKYFLGDISISELLRNIKDILITEEPSSDIEVAQIFEAGADYMSFMWKYTDYSRAEKVNRANILIDAFEKRYIAFDVKGDVMYTTIAAGEFITRCAKLLGFEQMKDRVLAMTIYADKSLYIHTVMVKKIAGVILKEIIDTNPEYLIGVAQMSLEQIKNNRESVMELMNESAMFHDIGKHMCIDYVSNSSRNLTDDEFSMIKYHPQNFDLFFTKRGDADFMCIRDCARLHHLWFNGAGGYPQKLKHTNNQAFVNILSLADSIDAATDIIGRPYTSGKTLDMLLDEFDTFRDTRYCAFCIDIIKRPRVKNEIQRLITEERKHVNYRIMTDKEI